MSKRKNRQPLKVNSIRESGDTLIACCSRANYDLRQFKSQALTWFVQFAIRADVEEAWKQPDTYSASNAEIAEEALSTAMRVRDSTANGHSWNVQEKS